MKRHLSRLNTLALATSLALWSTLAAADLPEVVLNIKNHKITAEVASTDTTRSTGLMHRRMCPKTAGCCSYSRKTAVHAMWMMNTYIPLSVAFIDANGVIINIEACNRTHRMRIRRRALRSMRWR